MDKPKRNLRLEYKLTFAVNLKLNLLDNFLDLGLSPNLVKALTEMKIVKPSEIQREVIPALLQTKTNLVGQAQTGTGKTAAYGLPLLETIDPKVPVIQGLILCPTRELSKQVSKQLFKFTKYTDKIFSEAVYGGGKIDDQIKALLRPTHIVVATPGRLIDLWKRKSIDLTNVKTVVLDEADEMLSLGFKKELDEILSFLSTVENKWLFSATMPDGITQIVNKHLTKDAVRIKIGGKGIVNKNISHEYIMCEEKDKLKTLMRVMEDQDDENQVVVFCKTKKAVQQLEEQLKKRNLNVAAIQGDLLQKERDKAMRAFKNKSAQFLIATDLAARGIDIDGLKLVVHFQLPDKEDYYTHRSGRTARAGAKGTSLAIVSSEDMKHIRYFERSLKIHFNEQR